MALTDAQKLQAKKHMYVWPHATTIDANIAALEDGDVIEAELIAALTLCNSTLTAVQAAQTASDELVEGGGAKFDYNRYISTRKRAYKDAQQDLARILGVDLSSRSGGAVATGWRVN